MIDGTISGPFYYFEKEEMGMLEETDAEINAADVESLGSDSDYFFEDDEAGFLSSEDEEKVNPK